MKPSLLLLAIYAACFGQTPQLPHAFSGGYALPNGWRITPLGKAIPTEDMVLKAAPAPDGRAVIALTSGFNPHGLVVMDTKTEDAVQRIGLKSAWYGLAWSRDGKKLYVSGGNANNGKNPTRAPIYVFGYANGRLSDRPETTLEETVDKSAIYWAGLAQHPKKNLLFAANRGTGPERGSVVVFDTVSQKLLTRIPVEVNPYDLVFSDDGATLYVSNWSSNSISVIDTAAMKAVASIQVGHNPNDLALSADGRLFVACSNENSVYAIDPKTRTVTERISTALFPRAPEGSTPNALTLDRANKLLYVANADNNDVEVINIAKPGDGEVAGFLPSGWYPSALALTEKGQKLWIGNSKGVASYADVGGPHSPFARAGTGNSEFKGDNVKTLQKGSVNIVSLSGMKNELRAWTKRVYENCPYNDKLLARAKPAPGASILPSEVGAGSPIEHVIYIIKENRTYDQVLGDLGKGNGDPRLTLFGRNVTPNQHAIAEQFVLFDNLYCDGEVSVDGHSWSNSAYATDYNEKLWPVTYGKHSLAGSNVAAYVPSAGHLWDACKRKGLTYRSYGEAASRASTDEPAEAAPGAEGLHGHISPDFKKPGARDTDNVRVFIREFDAYEKCFDDPDPQKRLPNYIVMSLPENHTRGTTPGAHTPAAMVANNDYAVGMLVERVTHSKYWPTTAIFIIEDDAQDGPDHVDARRTAGFAISPYIKRGAVDSTPYSTSSMLRTMELLLGLGPMTQYDAAASPMYAAFGTEADLTGYKCIPPMVDVNAVNTLRSYGARRSMQMDFSDVDLAPMDDLNEILWKSVKGAKSEMPAPVHSFVALR